MLSLIVDPYASPSIKTGIGFGRVPASTSPVVRSSGFDSYSARGSLCASPEVFPCLPIDISTVSLLGSRNRRTSQNGPSQKSTYISVVTISLPSYGL